MENPLARARRLVLLPVLVLVATAAGAQRPELVLESTETLGGGLPVLSPAGRFLAVSLPKGIEVLDRESGQRHATGVIGHVSSGPGPGRFYLGTQEAVLLYDAPRRETRTLLTRAEIDGARPTLVDYGEDDVFRVYGASHDGGLLIGDGEWDEHFRFAEGVLELGRRGKLRQVAWSPDRRWAAVAQWSWRCCGFCRPTGTLGFLDVETRSWTPKVLGGWSLPQAVVFLEDADNYLRADPERLVEARRADHRVLRTFDGAVVWLGRIDANHVLSHDHEALTLWDVASLEPVWHRPVEPDGTFAEEERTGVRAFVVEPHGFRRDWATRIHGITLAQDGGTVAVAGSSGVSVYAIVR